MAILVCVMILTMILHKNAFRSVPTAWELKGGIPLNASLEVARCANITYEKKIGPIGLFQKMMTPQFPDWT